MSITKTINCTVLVNDPMEEEILQMMVQDLNISIHCSFFTNCRKFVEELCKQDAVPDCIILDSDVGAMSRQECIEKIGQVPAMKRVPIFIFAGLLSDVETFRLKEQGVQGFIKKANSISEQKTNLLHFFTTTFAIDTETGI